MCLAWDNLGWPTVGSITSTEDSPPCAHRVAYRVWMLVGGGDSPFWLDGWVFNAGVSVGFDLLAQRPHKPGELARQGYDDLVARQATRGEFSISGA